VQEKKEGFDQLPSYSHASKKDVRGTQDGIVGIHTYNILANPDVIADFGLPPDFAETHSELSEAAFYSHAKEMREAALEIGKSVRFVPEQVAATVQLAQAPIDPDARALKAKPAVATESTSTTGDFDVMLPIAGGLTDLSNEMNGSSAIQAAQTPLKSGISSTVSYMHALLSTLEQEEAARIASNPSAPSRVPEIAQIRAMLAQFEEDSEAVIRERNMRSSADVSGGDGVGNGGSSGGISSLSNLGGERGGSVVVLSPLGGALHNVGSSGQNFTAIPEIGTDLLSSLRPSPADAAAHSSSATRIVPAAPAALVAPIASATPIDLVPAITQGESASELSVGTVAHHAFSKTPQDSIIGRARGAPGPRFIVNVGTVVDEAADVPAAPSLTATNLTSTAAVSVAEPSSLPPPPTEPVAIV
jgi:hypothetical protein